MCEYVLKDDDFTVQLTEKCFSSNNLSHSEKKPQFDILSIFHSNVTDELRVSSGLNKMEHSAAKKICTDTDEQQVHR